jgi:hypothetical protein
MDPSVIYDFKPAADARRVLLVHPPVFDTRFPWIDFQQPVALLQLSTMLRRSGCDIRLLDALANKHAERITRRRVAIFTRGTVRVNQWRWGIAGNLLAGLLEDYKREGWYPKDIYVQAGPPHQWQGSAEVAHLVRLVFPDAHVILFGLYPTLATEHACANSGADSLAIGEVQGLAGLPLDLSPYSILPRCSHLAIDTPERPISDLLTEVRTLAAPQDRKRRIRHIVFADPDVLGRFPEHARAVLQLAVDEQLGITFHDFGGVSPAVFANDGNLARLLLEAGLKQLIFANDCELARTHEACEQLLEDYRTAVTHCVVAGYQHRSGALVAAVCLGRPQERLTEVAAFLTELAHIAGSVIVRPYQPVPGECPGVPLEEQNGKLFPFAKPDQFREYLDLLGLAALLNSKWRSQTFDFLGESTVAQLVRKSLITESWKPPQGLDDRPVTVGWFGKDGRWVRPHK